MLDFGHQQWQVFDNSELLSLIIKVYIYIYRENKICVCTFQVINQLGEGNELNILDDDRLLVILNYCIYKCMWTNPHFHVADKGVRLKTYFFII